MSGRKADQDPISCHDCCANMQEYLDGTMAKTDSLRVFMHLRECAACAAESARWQAMFEQLDTLPAMAPPADFDRKILESVPYASYQAMAELRKPRVPVFLEENALPAVIRSLQTRLAGLAITVTAGAALAFFDAPGALGFVALAGILPEAAVRVQGLCRITLLAFQRNEG